jgi:hypothetical protein
VGVAVVSGDAVTPRVQVVVANGPLADDVVAAAPLGAMRQAIVVPAEADAAWAATDTWGLVAVIRTVVVYGRTTSCLTVSESPTSTVTDRARPVPVTVTTAGRNVWSGASGTGNTLGGVVLPVDSIAGVPDEPQAATSSGTARRAQPIPARHRRRRRSAMGCVLARRMPPVRRSSLWPPSG